MFSFYRNQIFMQCENVTVDGKSPLFVYVDTAYHWPRTQISISTQLIRLIILFIYYTGFSISISRFASLHNLIIHS